MQTVIAYSNPLHAWFWESQGYVIVAIVFAIFVLNVCIFTALVQPLLDKYSPNYNDFKQTYRGTSMFFFYILSTIVSSIVVIYFLIKHSII